MIRGCVVCAKVGDSFRIPKHDHLRAQAGRYFVYWSVLPFPVRVENTKIRCSEDVLGDTEQEALARRTRELGRVSSVAASVIQAQGEQEHERRREGDYLVESVLKEIDGKAAENCRSNVRHSG